MPALKMKVKSSMICSIQGSGLGVCKSSKISKNSCCRISHETEGLERCIINNKDISSTIELDDQKNECHEAVDSQEVFDGQSCQSQSPTLAAVNSPSDTAVRLEISQSQSPSVLALDSASDAMESLRAANTSDLDTIFSPIFESLEVHGKHDFYNYSVGNDGLVLAHVKTDEFGDKRSTSCDFQTCNISDFHISDMTVAGLPYDGTTGFDDIIEANPFSEQDMMFDITERYMILPFLEESADCSNVHDSESCEVATMSSDDACLYLAIQQMNSFNQEPGNSHSFEPDEVDVSDSQMYIRNLADLSDVVPNFWSMLPKEAQKRKSITLVLDLDETLVHSTLDHCDDADFTFPVFFNMKEHTVYVRRRPYLQTFLERVAEMFEIIIFTASQSNYAEKLLNILDPERKLISRRAYRESCIFSDGNYTKDLTVLGVDLAKVAIIDNSPQVFRLQVNNGIPIKSWFDDPSDRALISLLPFLETLVDADDVRPIIQKRFSNKE